MRSVGLAALASLGAVVVAVAQEAPAEDALTAIGKDVDAYAERVAALPAGSSPEGNALLRESDRARQKLYQHSPKTDPRWAALLRKHEGSVVALREKLSGKPYELRPLEQGAKDAIGILDRAEADIGAMKAGDQAAAQRVRTNLRSAHSMLVRCMNRRPDEWIDAMVRVDALQERLEQALKGGAGPAASGTPPPAADPSAA
jgi:hypothetical protein